MYKNLLYKIKYVVLKLFVNKIKYVNSYYDIKLTPMWGDNTFKFCYCGGYGDFFANYLRNLDKNFVFIDIGANQGLYSIIAGNNEFS